MRRTLLRRCSSKRQDFDASGEKEIREALRNVTDPGTGKSLLRLGGLVSVSTQKAQGLVTLELDLFVPGHPFASEIKASCVEALHKALPWIRKVETKLQQQQTSDKSSSSSSKIAHVIGVSSCKGGVGKSTVAVNLAYALARQGNGLRVGLLDADIYGPSVPLLTSSAVSPVVRKSSKDSKMVLPLEVSTTSSIDLGNEKVNLPLKVLSFGHVNPKAGAPGAGGKSAAIMRGPIATRVINQLVGATDWGDLDYLVVDMPPGTGDIQITLTQSMAFSGAVIVTTPHALSLIDAAKGVNMFQELKVPTLAIVENMSHFVCDLGTKYYPFGRGGKDKLLNALVDSNSSHESSSSSPPLASVPYHALPLSSTISDAIPVVLRSPSSEEAKTYTTLAKDIVLEILRIQLGAQLIPSITYVEDRGIVLRYFSQTNVAEYTIPTAELRCRDPKTGEKKMLSASHADAINAVPIKFDFKGNYGVSIIWSDGHYADIFPFDILRKIADETAIGAS